MNEAEKPGKNPPTDHYAVLRIRDFRLYLIGRLAAVFGQQMLTVAVGWHFISARTRHSRSASSALRK